MAAQVASLLINVAADIAKLTSDFDKAGKSVEGFGARVVAIGKTIAGVFAARAVINFGESIQQQLDNMSDAAENLKLPVEDFQTLQNAAYIAGQSIENTGNALAKFNQFLGKAEGGGKEQIELLNELGVTILNLDGTLKPTQQRLQEMALAITSIQSPARRSAVEMEVFGKSGQKVSAILEVWKRPLEDVNRQLSDLGLVHSPAVVKSLADQADAADKAAQKFAVLFAIVYAPVKSEAMGAVAATMERIAKAVIAMNGSEGVLARLAELMDAFTGGGISAAANAVTGGDTTQISRMTQQVTSLEERTVEAKKALRSLEESGQASTPAYANQVIAAAQLETSLKRAQDAQRKLIDMPGGFTVAADKDKPAAGGRNPPPKGTGGVDKYQEALRKIGNETEALKAAQDAYNQAASENLPTAVMERRAKLLEDIAKKQNDLGKGLTLDQAAETDKRVKALEMERFGFEEMKRITREGDAISRQYGDGKKELLETQYRLNEAFRAGKITQEELTAATAAANEKQAEQALLSKQNVEGIEGLAAGFEYAALKMSQQQNAFNTGSQLFTAGVNTMTDAVIDFAETGGQNFEKLAASFAKMLAQMALQMVIHAGLKRVLGLFAGPTADSIMGLVPASASMPSGGARQHGGPVMPGYGYTVGEQGPERFVPTIPGRIEPANSNDSSGSVSVNVDMRGTDSAKGTDPMAGMDFARRVRSAVVDVINNEKRPGGSLYRR
jgi:lambda family phage tail tape measure protein